MFLTTKKIVLMSTDAQKLSVAELAGKFELDQRNELASSSTKPKDIEESGTTLNLGKVLKEMKRNMSLEDPGDTELVLMSYMVKKFLNRKNKMSFTSASKREKLTVTC